MLSKTFIFIWRVHRGYITLWRRQISMKTYETKWFCIVPADFISNYELRNRKPALTHQLQLIYDSNTFHLNSYEQSYVYTSDGIRNTDITSDRFIEMGYRWFKYPFIFSTYLSQIRFRVYLNKLLMNSLSSSDNTSVIVKVVQQDL